MDTWIVTGGAGFIGSNFARLALARSEARVVVVDKLTYAGNLESLADVAEHPRFHFVKADIADRAAVDQIIQEHRPSAILNFAAETHVDRSIDGPSAFIQTNVCGAFELLDAARHHLAQLDGDSRRRFRFLHVSTDEVYGSLGADRGVQRDHALRPELPLFRLQGRRRPPGARLPRHLRPADARSRTARTTTGRTSIPRS